jgi:CRISPR-associated endonuclease Csy4
MDHYIDIQVLPDPEFKATTLLNAVYSKLHRALVSLGREDLGVSFPEAAKAPGSLLRLHSGKASLESLMALGWLKGLRDYTQVSAPAPVPTNAEFVRVQRVQPKQTAARLRRAVKRNSLQESEAEAILGDRVPFKKPYFRLQSESTGQSFLLFIEQSNPQDYPVEGPYNTYGLSQTATVPWF